MASEQAQMMRSLLAAMREANAGRQLDDLSVEDMRAGAEQGMAMMGVMPDGVTVSDTTAGGRPALWIVPDGVPSDRVLLYLHGGAYVLLSPQSHVKLTAGIAKAAGVRALSLDYRLAPEHPHPAAVTDAVAAYRWLLDQGFAPEAIAISGDSAGGGLTLAPLLALREQGLPQPAAAVPLSPWTDLEGTGESMTSNAERDLMIQAAPLRHSAGLFVGDGDVRDPLAAPVHADFTAVAPLYSQVGGDETLLDDSTRVAVKAAHAGCDVRLDVFPEMQHVFQAALGMLPEADDAVARIGAYLRPRLGVTS